ncbi:hypothetical protein DMUE_6053, partial [Dictyocoela muelleri]
RDYFNSIRRNLADKTEIGTNIDSSKCLTLDGKKFLRLETGVNSDERIIIYVSDYFLNLMKKSKVFLADSTFKIAPLQFYQLHTIHIQYFNKIIPAMFVLMKRKTITSYNVIYNFLLDRGVNPDYFILDFEQAQFTSIRNVFPACKIYTCYFHLSQIFWRHLQKSECVGIYLSSKDFRFNCKLILALAYIKETDTISGYEKLRKIFDNKENSRELITILEYFKSNFLIFHGDTPKNVGIWNLYYRVLNNIPTTTNSLEAWHGHINRKAKTPHPNYDRLMGLLKKEEERSRIVSKNLYDGTLKVRKISHSVIIILQNYEFYNVEEILYSIAKSIELKFN